MIGRLFKSWVGREKRRRRRCKCRIEGADLSTGKKEKKKHSLHLPHLQLRRPVPASHPTVASGEVEPTIEQHALGRG